MERTYFETTWRDSWPGAIGRLQIFPDGKATKCTLGRGKTHFNIVIPFLTVISSTLLALLINVIFLFINLNITSYSNIFNWIILPTFLLMCFISLGISFKSFRKKNFYDDILKIVKECQNSLDEYFLANFKSDAKRMQNMKLVVKITSNKSLSRSKRFRENRKPYTKSGHRKQWMIE